MAGTSSRVGASSRGVGRLGAAAVRAAAWLTPLGGFVAMRRAAAISPSSTPLTIAPSTSSSMARATSSWRVALVSGLEYDYLYTELQLGKPQDANVLALSGTSLSR